VKKEAPREEAAAEINEEPLPALPDRFDVGLAEINTKLDAVLARMDAGFARMDAGFTEIKERIENVENQVQDLKESMH